eukprot:3894690-Pleurochrysis_carterae.AAC.1
MRLYSPARGRGRRSVGRPAPRDGGHWSGGLRAQRARPLRVGREARQRRLGIARKSVQLVEERRHAVDHAIDSPCIHG